MQKAANAGNCNSTNQRMRRADRNRNTPQQVKENLRQTIMAKRHARGEDDIKLEFEQPDNRELTEAERERKERRREQNRRAAQKCRLKKRDHQLSATQICQWHKNRNHALEEEIVRLQKQYLQLQQWVRRMEEQQRLTVDENRQLRVLMKQHQVPVPPELAPSDPPPATTSYPTILPTPDGPVVKKIKVEPREGSPAGYGCDPSPKPLGSNAACQYQGLLLMEMNPAELHSSYGAGSCGNIPVPPFTPAKVSPTQPSPGGCGYYPNNFPVSPQNCNTQVASMQPSQPPPQPQQRCLSRVSPGHNNPVSNSYSQIHTGHPHTPDSVKTVATSSPKNFNHSNGVVNNSHCSYQNQGYPNSNNGFNQFGEAPSISSSRFRHGSGNVEAQSTMYPAFGSASNSPAMAGVNSNNPLHQQHSGMPMQRSGSNVGGGPASQVSHISLDLPHIAGVGPGQRSACYDMFTPLSADGRHSISSVSSDVSGASEKPRGDCDVRVSPECGDVTFASDELANDFPPSDELSQLLQYMQTTGTIFLDDVFGGADGGDNMSALSSLPDQFLLQQSRPEQNGNI